ncbi:hypothetical protein Cgig2_031372 [Carnegiea gigantea]|uniref:Uncharacterized protein n=1 Tax=Carnegiea gigantea TaxID=171969 RepID=A0A9Q1Q455_9CARY|nr:hypothetical protein Cgig2_031372 [Carnegiea gigantea]
MDDRHNGISPQRVAAWVRHNRGRILEAHQQKALSDSEEEESSGSDGQTPSPIADHVRETFKWHLRRASHPPCRSPKITRTCVRASLFLRQRKRRATLTFLRSSRPHFMLCWNDTVELSMPLPKDYHSLHPYFDLDMAEVFAFDFHIPELTQAVFYAMVLNDVVVLGVSCVIMADTLTSVMECLNWVFLNPGAPTCSDIQDRPRTHFPNPKVVASLKGPALEKKYLLLAGYRFVLLEADAMVNKPPSKCIVMYQVASSCDVMFPLHSVIVDILNKYELVPAQIVPKS